MQIFVTFWDWIKTLGLHLWLSISSVKFYEDVYKYYRGYGIKYMLTVSFIAAIITCGYVLYITQSMTDYLLYSRDSQPTAGLKYILQQLPDMYYDGDTLSSDDEEPVYLKDSMGRKVVAIDLKNKLNYNDKLKIPIVLTPKQIIVSVMEMTDQKRYEQELPYAALFGKTPQIVTDESIKSILGEKISYFSSVFMYIGVPIAVIAWCAMVFANQSFAILIIYILANIFRLRMSLQQSMRLVLFSCGMSVLLQPIVLIIIPIFSNVIWALQMWSNFLMVLAILKIRNNPGDVAEV